MFRLRYPGLVVFWDQGLMRGTMENGMDNEMEALTVAGLIGCLIEPSSF